MSIEDILVNNIKDNYTKALTNKIYLDELIDKRLHLNLGNTKSLYIFGGNSNIINLPAAHPASWLRPRITPRPQKNQKNDRKWSKIVETH